MLSKYKVQITLIQETKLGVMHDSVAKQLWGSKRVGWLSVDAVGSTRGVLILWDSRYVAATDS